MLQISESCWKLKARSGLQSLIANWKDFLKFNKVWCSHIVLSVIGFIIKLMLIECMMPVSDMINKKYCFFKFCREIGQTLLNHNTELRHSTVSIEEIIAKHRNVGG